MLLRDGSRTGYNADVVRVGPTGKSLRRRSVCAYSWVGSGPFYPSCTGIDGLAVSPDGQGVTVLGRTLARDQAGQYTYSSWVEDLAFGGAQRWRAPLTAEDSTGVQYQYSSPRWAPDGSQLLIARTRDVRVRGPNGVERPGHDGIWLFDAAGRARGQLIGGDARDADWSARGEIVYVAGWTPPHAGSLFRVRPGHSAVRITGRGAADPSWSPDGTKVAFVRRCPPIRLRLTDDPCIYVMSVRRGRPRLLARRATNPAWSPDGTRIAFLRPYLPDGVDPIEIGRALFTAEPKTGRVRRLTGRLDNLAASYVDVADLAWLARR